MNNENVNQTYYEGVGMEITANGDIFVDFENFESLKNNDNVNFYKKPMSEDWTVATVGMSSDSDSLSLDKTRSVLLCSDNCSSDEHDDIDNESLNAWIASSMEEYNGVGGHMIYNNISSSENNNIEKNNDLPFMILGISPCNDGPGGASHVLSPPLMESLQSFFPYSKLNDNFWMRYSLVRDGDSILTFLEKSHGAKHSIIAIETLEGEVFGAYTTEHWRKSWASFGTGESFLWKMRHSRYHHSRRGHHRRSSAFIKNIIQRESEIDVYPFTGDNDIIQICNHNKIAVGGGSPRYDAKMVHNCYSNINNNNKRDRIQSDPGDILQRRKCGYGLCIEDNMRYGTTSPCVTFGSPSLSKEHSDGSRFEIRNLELWSLTPCILEEDAKQMETSMLFFEERQR